MNNTIKIKVRYYHFKIIIVPILYQLGIIYFILNRYILIT